MSKKRKPVFLFVILILVAATLTLVYLASSNPRLEASQTAAEYKDLEAFKSAILGDAVKSSVSNLVKGADADINVEMDQNEISGLASLIVRQIENRSDNISFSAYDCRFVDDKIEIRLDSTLLNILPVQYVFRLLPSMEDSKIKIHIDSIKIGKLGIPAGLALKWIKFPENDTYYIDSEKQSIYVDNSSHEQLEFKDIQVKDNKLQMKVKLSIKNLGDLVDLFGQVLPEGIKLPSN